MKNKMRLLCTLLVLILLSGFSYAISPEYAKKNNLTEKTITSKKPDFVPFASPIEPKCYQLLGFTLKDTINILVNPTNYSGLSNFAVESATKNATDTWEIYNKKIFGTVKMDPNSTIDTSGDNTFIYFNKNSKLGKNVGAQATIYYIEDKLIGANIEVNAKDFEWGDYLQNQDKMDFQGTLTHELGHVIGLLDVFTIGCENHTMFGMFQGEKGSYEARTLEFGDKFGLFVLYSNIGKYGKIPFYQVKYFKYFK